MENEKPGLEDKQVETSWLLFVFHCLRRQQRDM